MSSRFGYAVVVCTSLGCNAKQRHAQPAPSASSPALTRSASTAPAASSALAAPSGFDETSARRFIERWLNAQNEHDFSAYSLLYGSRFSGTKRVGSYTKRFDRSSWLRDRQPMFRDGVVVRASELQLSGSVGAVRAVFTQDFVA